MRIMLMFGLGLLIMPAVWAQGLVVAPTRIVLEPDQRTTEAAVSNFTERTVRYRITLDDLAMGENGVTKLVSGTFAYSVKPFVRFMPKTLTLAPGQRQTIRIMATRPADLAEGDYHSHLVLNEIFTPAAVTPTDPSPTQARDEQGLVVRIGFSYTTGVPLIVQVGEVSSTLTLEGANLVRDEGGKGVGLSLQVRRTGNSEGAALLRGKVGDMEAFMPRMVRIYRELENATVAQQIKPEAVAAMAKGLPLQLEWVDEEDRTTVRQTLTVK